MLRNEVNIYQVYDIDERNFKWYSLQKQKINRNMHPEVVSNKKKTCFFCCYYLNKQMV